MGDVMQHLFGIRRDEHCLVRKLCTQLGVVNDEGVQCLPTLLHSYIESVESGDFRRRYGRTRHLGPKQGGPSCARQLVKQRKKINTQPHARIHEQVHVCKSKKIKAWQLSPAYHTVLASYVQHCHHVTRTCNTKEPAQSLEI